MIYSCLLLAKAVVSRVRVGDRYYHAATRASATVAEEHPDRVLLAEDRTGGTCVAYLDETGELAARHGWAKAEVMS